MKVLFFKSKMFILKTLLCFFVLNLAAQNSVTFDKLTTRDGLSQNDVNAIYQDDKGYMWFGTHDGLNRYDGYEFTVFTPDLSNDKSINSNLIWKIIGDEKRGLWIATTGNGINYFNSETEEFTHFINDKNDENSLSNNYVTSVMIDSENRLWITTAVGIDMLDLNLPLEEAKFIHCNLNKDKVFDVWNGTHIAQIYEDSHKQIWAAGAKGIHKLESDKDGHKYFQRYNVFLGIPEAGVRCLNEDQYGNLIIGTHNNIYVVSKRGYSKKAMNVYWGNFNSIVVDKDFIWAATNKGLMQFKTLDDGAKPVLINYYKNDPNQRRSLSSNSIKSLFLDDTGILWIGTYGAGINKYDPHKKQFQHFFKTGESGSLSSNKIRSVGEDKNGFLWIGTEGGGLDVLSRKNDDGSYNKFEHITDYITAFTIGNVTIGGRNKVVIGGQSTPNLYMVDVTEEKPVSELFFEPIKEVTSTVFSVLQDSKLNLWIGTYTGGVRRWLASGSAGEFKKDILFKNDNQEKSISNNIVRDIYEDHFGNMWFATGDGLNMLTKEEAVARNPKFIVYKNNRKDSTSISHNYILTLYESSKGDMWIGTFGGGLNKFIPATETEPAHFKRYSTLQGLPNNVIKGILEDEQGNLWVSTNRGISRFDPEHEVFKNYDVNDGLQSDEFGELACVIRKTGEFIFGGVNGFNSFYPEEIKSNNINAETVLTDFLIFNKSVKIGEEINGRVVIDKSIDEVNEIELLHNENSFSFEFAALHYAASNKNTYAYKLEGFNKKWLYTTSENRYATYTNLEPGSYTLKVKSSNNDGVWDTTPVELKIKVIPPIWKTSYAKTFYLLCILGLLFAFRRFTIIKTTKKYNLELEHMEKEKKEEIHKLKLEFFTNISHEFRTPLTLINGPLDYLLKQGDDITPKEARIQYNLMKKNTGYLLRLVNQLIDFRKMDRGKLDLNIAKGNIVAFLKEVGEPFQFLGRKKNINFEVVNKEDSILSWFDSDALEKVVNNLLSNAFKFTPEEGEISLEITEADAYPELQEISRGIDIKDYILIKVQDSGPGIPAHRINHVFERFYMEVDKLKMNMKGSGIGLSFTKNLVELHQGVISVKSNNDDGTCFYVWLPKAKSAYVDKKGVSFQQDFETDSFISQEDAESQAIDVMDEIVDSNINRSRSKLPVLLIVDDNQDIRLFIKQGLGESYYIYEAENGEQGFEVAKKVTPNIIITDLMMPVMDGVEFCKSLKTTQETSHIPVIMLTAKMSQESEIQGLKTGADAYIRKPFDMELLHLKLQNILKYRQELRKRFNREITLQPTEVTVTSTDEDFLQRAIGVVEKHMMDTEFSVEFLVKEMYLSRSHFYLKIKELTGLSSSEFIRNIRLKRAMQLLTDSDLAVKEIMYMTGFNTASYFSKCFRKQFGLIPSEYLKQIKGDTGIEGAEPFKEL